MLAESECLCAAEWTTASLGLLLDLGEAFLAVLLEVLILHLNIVLWVTFRSVLFEEFAVATFQDVHFGVGELWVLEVIDGPVFVADELGHEWGAVLGVFAVEDEEGVG